MLIPEPLHAYKQKAAQFVKVRQVRAGRRLSLAHKKPPLPRTIQYDPVQGPKGFLEGVAVSDERGTPVVDTPRFLRCAAPSALAVLFVWCADPCILNATGSRAVCRQRRHIRTGRRLAIADTNGLRRRLRRLA